MRPEVKSFVELGPLPSIDSGQDAIARAETALHAISQPVTDAEAEALLDCFGADDCFGLAWTLVHLIETSPTPLPRSAPGEVDNAWLHLLHARAQNAL
ncbi:MAG: hypothetical protein QNJ09_00270 [Paracoccaceae bacterium]|nr:hypothetical protein [Paracoccaceae bacterium]